MRSQIYQEGDPICNFTFDFRIWNSHPCREDAPIAILLINANPRCVEPLFAIIRAYCF